VLSKIGSLFELISIRNKIFRIFFFIRWDGVWKHASIFQQSFQEVCRKQPINCQLKLLSFFDGKEVPFQFKCRWILHNNEQQNEEVSYIIPKSLQSLQKKLFNFSNVCTAITTQNNVPFLLSQSNIPQQFKYFGCCSTLLFLTFENENALLENGKSLINFSMLFRPGMCCSGPSNGK
jgi:hypothetical protein